VRQRVSAGVARKTCRRDRCGKGQHTFSVVAEDVEVPLCVVNALEQQESNAPARGRSARARRGARPARLRRPSGTARAPLRRF